MLGQHNLVGVGLLEEVGGGAIGFDGGDDGVGGGQLGEELLNVVGGSVGEDEPEGGLGGGVDGGQDFSRLLGEGLAAKPTAVIDAVISTVRLG